MDRVLVVLPNWFGETLFATPFLRALRSQRPQAFIAALGWSQCREVLLHSPLIDEFLAYDERGAARGLGAKVRLIGALHARRFDTAFILRKSLSRSLLLRLAGIPVRVGFDNAKSGWLLTRRVPLPAGPVHKASTYPELLRAVGLSNVAGPYEFTVSEPERASARALLRGVLTSDGRALVMLHPGANWFHKRWAASRFAALADRLTEQERVQVAVTGGPDDVAVARQIAEAMRRSPLVLAGRTTLRELAACLEQAQLVVSTDTGVLHIAAALRRPVVALYGPTSPQLTGPLGDPERTVVLHHADCCPEVPCYRPDHPGFPGMDAISIEEVYRAACQLLGVEVR